jgi:hypothetical protein
MAAPQSYFPSFRRKFCAECGPSGLGRMPDCTRWNPQFGKRLGAAVPDILTRAGVAAFG